MPRAWHLGIEDTRIGLNVETQDDRGSLASPAATAFDHAAERGHRQGILDLRYRNAHHPALTPVPATGSWE